MLRNTWEAWAQATRWTDGRMGEHPASYPRWLAASKGKHHLASLARSPSQPEGAMLCLIALTPSPAAPRMAEGGQLVRSSWASKCATCPGHGRETSLQTGRLTPPMDRECVLRVVRSVISFSSVSLFALVIITAPRGGDRS